MNNKILDGLKLLFSEEETEKIKKDLDRKYAYSLRLAGEKAVEICKQIKDKNRFDEAQKEKISEAINSLFDLVSKLEYEMTETAITVEKKYLLKQASGARYSCIVTSDIFKYSNVMNKEETYIYLHTFCGEVTVKVQIIKEIDEKNFLRIFEFSGNCEKIICEDDDTENNKYIVFYTDKGRVEISNKEMLQFDLM